MLMFAKRMPLWEERRRAHDCTRYTSETIPVSMEGMTIGVLGLGAIGTEIARLSRAMGMRVLATRRAIRERTGPTELVDETYPASETDRVLEVSDFVAIALPQTRETVKSFGRRELGLMKPSAYLVNVGRGTIIDEAALVDALGERRIAGAALDVFEQEPLPNDSPLWDLDNLIFSPHISGAVSDSPERMTRIFAENLRRYVADEPLLYVVDQEAGY